MMHDRAIAKLFNSLRLIFFRLPSTTFMKWVCWSSVFQSLFLSRFRNLQYAQSPVKHLISKKGLIAKHCGGPHSHWEVSTTSSKSERLAEHSSNFSDHILYF